MRIFAIKQAYRVRSLLFLSFLCMVSLGLIGGCSDSNNSINYTALSENDFTEDSFLRARLDRGVIVTFLEAPSSEAPEKDTGEVGIDLIPLTYPKTTEQRFCWEDDKIDAMHFAELLDSDGSLVLTVEANGDCVEEVIKTGDYSLSIHHDGSTEDSLPIFLIPQAEDSGQARETDGLIDRVTVAAAEIFNAIQMTVAKDAQAQDIKNIETLLSTIHCDLCHLVDVDLRDTELCDVDLFGSDLRGADFTGAFLKGGTAASTIIGHQTISNPSWTNILTGVWGESSSTINNIYTPWTYDAPQFVFTLMETVDFSDAELEIADFTGANITFSNFSGAELIGTDFSGATWCDGCICAEGSIGGCNGCAPVEQVCTGL